MTVSFSGTQSFNIMLSLFWRGEDFYPNCHLAPNWSYISLKTFGTFIKY